MVFNFDEWAQLAERDKVAFEEKRTRVLKQVIDKYAKTDAETRMLNGLQFKIDMMRRQHKTPLAACIAISDMLMEHAYRMANPDVNTIVNGLTNTTHSETTSCKIIPFKHREK